MVGKVLPFSTKTFYFIPETEILCVGTGGTESHVLYAMHNILMIQLNRTDKNRIMSSKEEMADSGEFTVSNRGNTLCLKDHYNIP